MTMRVVFLDRASLKARIRPLAFEADYVEYASTGSEEVLDRLLGADIAITNKVALRGEHLQQLPQLKMIAVAATGYDIVDVSFCQSHGIAVANIRNYAVHTVPEHTFALILALKRNLIAYRQDVDEGRWNQSDQFCLLNHSIGDLHGLTLGIIGEGAIGQSVAAIARAFGMSVLFAEHTPRRSKDLHFAALDQLLALSDIVSLHCPLTPVTRNLIGEQELRKMKPTAFLVNTARGGLVDESALIRALDGGWIAGAGFDVLTAEPPKNGHPLLDVHRTNFILTPHVAWASDGAMQFLADQLIENIEHWVAGKPQHLVT